jgi:EAL domain-containing protein (putative c-di-GMP-specific phosphodiesterase class I)
MRWTHPEKGPIGPGVFIPIAEKSGLIVDASRWAVKESLAGLKRIEDALGRKHELQMSINFSSHDFAEENFLQGILDVAKTNDIKPEQIKLEITERLLIQQPDNAKDTLKACRKAGVGVSIDDFGTGFSSLKYLKEFPINIIKVDKSFVDDIGKNKNNEAIILTTLSMAEQLNMSCVAEGIETIEQVEFFKKHQCQHLQGYYFSKPVPAKDIEKLLSKEW